MQAECALKLPGPRCSPSSSCWGHSVWSPTSRKSCWHPDGAGWGMGSPWSPQFWGWERGPCTVSGQRWLQTSCGLRALRSSPTADPALAHQGESRWRKHGLCLVPVSRGTRGCRILSTLALAVSPRCQLTKHRVGNPTARPGQGSSLACQEKFPACSRGARFNCRARLLRLPGRFCAGGCWPPPSGTSCAGRPRGTAWADLAGDERRRFPTAACEQARCKTPPVGSLPSWAESPLRGTRFGGLKITRVGAGSDRSRSIHTPSSAGARGLHQK